MTPRILPHTVIVPVADDATMTMPRARLEWVLRYGHPEDVQYSAASAIASFRYLVLECSRDEAWRRIMLMRNAMKDIVEDA